MGDENRERFEVLYGAHYERVLAYALCRAPADVARDVAADTFVVAWRRLGDVPPDPLPWLIGVARRCLADQRRSSGRRDALASRLRQVCPVPAAWDDHPAEAVAERQQVLAALRRLGAADRELLRLVAWDELSSDQAAQSLGCSRATFAVRLHRARRRLVTAMAAEEIGDGGSATFGARPIEPEAASPRPRFASVLPPAAGGATRVACMPTTPLSARPEEAS